MDATTVVLTDVRDGDGTMWRAVTLLTVIAERFPGGLGFEDFMLDNGIEGSFWNRIGD